jgi:glycosyltransferase involved in cell wall biosynthesis
MFRRNKSILFFTIGVLLFVTVLWLWSNYKFNYYVYKARPYITEEEWTTLIENRIETDSKRRVYTWMIHMYPPEHNAGAEWMAHTMNTYLIREANAKVNIILNKKTVDQYERVKIISRKDKQGIQGALKDTNVLVSHLDMEPNAVNTALIVEKPLVLVMHNSFRMKYLKVFKDILGPNLYLVHNSKWIQEYYRPLGIPSIVVYPPVDWRDYSITSSRQYVSLINMNKNKGGEIFLKLVEAMPDIEFLGVKGAYDKQMIKQYKNLTLIDNTPHIKEVYSKTDILVMPSKYESWGRTAVEAMSSGIPVIAHPTPGLKESCGDAGIFCDREDIQAWIREIRRLKTDSAYYTKKSAACLARAKELDPESQLAEFSKWISKLEWKSNPLPLH